MSLFCRATLLGWPCLENVMSTSSKAERNHMNEDIPTVHILISQFCVYIYVGRVGHTSKKCFYAYFFCVYTYVCVHHIQIQSDTHVSSFLYPSMRLHSKFLLLVWGGFWKVSCKVVTRWQSEEMSGITHSYSKHLVLRQIAKDAMNQNNSKGRHKTLSSNKGELPWNTFTLDFQGKGTKSSRISQSFSPRQFSTTSGQTLRRPNIAQSPAFQAELLQPKACARYLSDLGLD